MFDIKEGIKGRASSAARKVKRAFKNKKVRIAAIVCGSAAALLIIMLAVAGMYSSGMNVIGPDLTVCGTQVGGMTQSEAEAALSGQFVPEDEADSVKIILSRDKTLELTTVDAGIELSAGKAARIAFNYGKDSNVFTNGWRYLKMALSGAALEPENSGQIREDAIRKLIREEAAEVSTEGTEDKYTIGKDSIEIVKGIQPIEIDEDDIYSLIEDCFEKKEYEPVEYVNDKVQLYEDVDLQQIYDEIYVEPVNAKYDSETGKAGKHVTGVSFDLKNAEKMYAEASGGEKIEIPIIKTEPEITEKKLNDMLFRDKLSSRSTYMSGTWQRVNNITLTARAVNGTVLNPGDEFSFNGIVGERTADKGYAAAPAYIGGQTVDEVGGGICQTSSTIYVCALYADMEITERSEHMFAVGYLPLGFDATVNWGTLDMRFVNNKEYPVKVVAYTDDNGYLTVEFWGTKTDDTTIDIESVTTGVYNYSVVEKEDTSGTLAPGERRTETSGYTGYSAETYKYVYDGNGELISKELVSTSVYDKRDEVVLVGKAAEKASTEKDTKT